MGIFYYLRIKVNLSLIILTLFLGSCELTKEEKKLNVLFIITDDLNCNIGAYGHPLVKTPNIDKLASDGMLFNQAFCNFPLCGPSRASLMMGLYPDQSGHHKLRDLIRDHVPDVTTLSQVFMNNGYEATRVGKIYHYNNPKDIGTPGHDDSLSWNRRYYPIGRDKLEEDKIFSLNPGKFGATLSWMAAEGKDEEQTDGLVAEKAVQLISEYAKEENPFFLAVGFYKPHTPYVAPKKYFEMYDKEDIIVPKVPEGYLETLPLPAQKYLTRFEHQNNLSDSLARCAIQAYYATITFLDAQVGKVLEGLEANGLKDNTIVVFTSDHGYHMGEHGYYQKKTLFEDSDRIPLIISAPKMEHHGANTKAIVEMIDLYPTLCSMAGLKYPEYVAGIDITPSLQDPSKPLRNSALSQIDGGYTVRTDNFRFTRWGKGGENMIELYDRKIDPAEMNNLAGNIKYKTEIIRLEQLLDSRIKAANKEPVGLKVIR